MTTHVHSDEAARILGVTKPTLYAYVSRGQISRRLALDGRTSLYPRDELEALAHRSRRPPPPRPSIDVRIHSDITELHDDGPIVCDVPLTELIGSASFEQAAELLWSGRLPDDRPTWPIDEDLLERAAQIVGRSMSGRLIDALVLTAATAASGPSPRSPSTPSAAARRLLGVVPSVLGGGDDGDIARRLADVVSSSPAAELVAAFDACLVALVDHELATSTLGVRLATSVRVEPALALVTGLTIVSGDLHGGAPAAAYDLLTAAHTEGVDAVVARRRAGIGPVPGFGHSVYRHGDPRFAPVMQRVRSLPDPDGRLATIDELLVVAGERLDQLPNIDLAVAALLFVADAPSDLPLFATARIAGWAAHIAEETTEQPLRFRGLTAPRHRR